MIWNGAVGNLTLTNPANANVSADYHTVLPSSPNYGTITFTLPYGFYYYKANIGYAGFVYGQIAFSSPNLPPVEISTASACTALP